MAEAFLKLRTCACDPVGEEVGLQAQPQPLNGVEVRTVRRQEQGLEVMPVKCFDLVPGGVVEHQHPAQARLGWHAARQFVKPALEEALSTPSNMRLKNSPFCGHTAPTTLRRICLPRCGTLGLLPGCTHRRLGRGSPSTPHSSPNHSSTCGSAASVVTCVRKLWRRVSRSGSSSRGNGAEVAEIEEGCGNLRSDGGQAGDGEWLGCCQEAELRWGSRADAEGRMGADTSLD